MKYSEAKLKDGQLIFVNEIEVDQNKLTADCWLIQIKGLIACETCELKDTDECGGKEILKKIY